MEAFYMKVNGSSLTLQLSEWAVAYNYGPMVLATKVTGAKVKPVAPVD